MENNNLLNLKSELEKLNKELAELQERKRKIGVEVKKLITHKEELEDLSNKKSVIKFYEFDRKTRLEKEIKEHNASLNAVAERMEKTYGIKSIEESEKTISELTKKIKSIQSGALKLNNELEKYEKKHKKN